MSQVKLRQPTYQARAFQYGLKSLLTVMTVAAVVLGAHTCPPPAGKLLMKVVGGMALFMPILLAVYFADWFERRRRS
ncbi:MAG TPA: hypothetical protein VFI31_24625 [Pirellulales bacterium]|nr:hypothetical protein [Pirellulales bacterium]